MSRFPVVGIYQFLSIYFWPTWRSIHTLGLQVHSEKVFGVGARRVQIPSEEETSWSPRGSENHMVWTSKIRTLEPPCHVLPSGSVPVFRSVLRMFTPRLTSVGLDTYRHLQWRSWSSLLLWIVGRLFSGQLTGPTRTQNLQPHPDRMI